MFDVDAELEDLLRRICGGLVDRPESLNIIAHATPQFLFFTISAVDPTDSDLGKVIGKGGANADAVRKILNAAAAKHKRRLNIHIE